MLSSVELSQFPHFFVFLGKGCVYFVALVWVLVLFIKMAQKRMFFGFFFQNVGTTYIINYNNEQ